MTNTTLAPSVIRGPWRSTEPEPTFSTPGESPVSTHWVAEFTEQLTSTLVAFQREAAHYFVFPLNALPRPGLQLRHPLLVSVQRDAPGSFIAEVPEAGAVGYGETAAEAVNALGYDLCELYDELAGQDDAHLGPRPRGWRTALQQLLEPAPR